MKSKKGKLFWDWLEVGKDKKTFANEGGYNLSTIKF